VIEQEDRFVEMGLLHDSIPFSGMAASSAVNVARRDTHLRWSRVLTRMDAQIQLDNTTAGDARRAEGWSVLRKPNRDGQVAPKRRTRYFLFQPSLPLIQATLVRGAFVLIARVRPVFFPRVRSHSSLIREAVLV
jgi:hypothetical protein